MKAAFLDWDSLNGMEWCLNPSYDWLFNIGLVCFDKDENWTNQGSPKTKTKHKPSGAEEKSALLCANCRTAITSSAHRTEMAGAHQHHFTNPNAQTFDISLFATANVIAHGITTTEFSWFPGYAWQVVLCPHCQVQLGWRFRRGDSPDFYGLITDHLVLDS